MSTDHQYDVVIVGGGFAGLSAAAALVERGVENLLVLEARDRVGGRSHTLATADGLPLDVGAAYVGPTQNRLWRLCHRFGVQSKPVYISGKSVTSVHGRQYTHMGSIPSLSIFSLLDINAAMVATDALASQISLMAPWSTATELDLDRVTMEQWIDRHCETDTGKELYRGVVRNLCCVEPAEISALYWILAVATVGGTYRMIETDNGAQERKLVGGTQQLCHRLVDDVIGHNKIRLSAPVQSIHCTGNDTIVVESSGERFRSRRVIVALQHSLYQTIEFQPPLPSIKADNARKMYSGSIIKVLVRYASPFWRERGFNGSFFDVNGNILGGCYDDCQFADGKSYYGLIGFVLANQARQWSSKSRDDRQQAICQQFAKVFDSNEALNPIGYVECDWEAEQYTRGCYCNVAGPNILTAICEHLRTPVNDKLFFASTETAVNHAGYIDGAIESGERAGHEVLQSLGIVDRSAEFVFTEPVNTEWECQPRPVPTSFIERHLPRTSSVYWSLWGIGAAAAAGLAVYLRSRL